MINSGSARQQSLSARHYLSKVTTETALQNTVSMTARLLGFPMVQVNVVDAESQHTIAAVGTPLESIPRSASLCDRVVSEGSARSFEDFAAIPPNLAHIKAYAGVPISGREGLVIGTLCVLDTVPRSIDDQQLVDLKAAAAVVQDQLELLRRLGPAPVGTAAEAATLLAAIESGQIVPYYQAVVDILTDEVKGFEALARWENPDRGLIQPGGFVPLAEDSDIVIELDLAVLTRAVADLAGWHRTHPVLGLNINLSARHFDRLDCVDRLTDIVGTSEVEPSDVTFEVTETAALASHSIDRSILTELRARGFKIVLDDFGTGFSSMTRVLGLPIDGIKLDHSLTVAMGTPEGDAVSRALLGLAADLGLSTVIEGVETAEQADRALQQGCHHGQGFLWSAPIPAADVPDRLLRNRPALVQRSSAPDDSGRQRDERRRST